MDAGAILQRTDIGRDTIKNKSVKLTQSERLLLIVVDGITPLKALRQKMWALTEERFARALNTLLKENLVYEVLFPLEGQQAEEFDTTVVNRFLQQDPLDPVTVIRVDPEDELDTNLIEEMGYVLPAPVTKPAPQGRLLPEVASPPTAPAMPSASLPAPCSDDESFPKPSSKVHSDIPFKPLPGMPSKEQSDGMSTVSLTSTPTIDVKPLPKTDLSRTELLGKELLRAELLRTEVLKAERPKTAPPEKWLGKELDVYRRTNWSGHMVEWCSWVALISGTIMLFGYVIYASSTLGP